MGELSAEELRRRSIEGVRAEIELFGSGSPQGSLVRRDGLLASVSPATPGRSLFNSVFAESPEALAAALDELTAVYETAGVGAWTVWVPDEDEASAARLAARGHVLDGSPRAMALDLGDLIAPPSRPGAERVEIGPGETAVAAWLNDRAYGYETGAFSVALTAPSPASVRWLVAHRDGQPVACCGAIDVGDDVCVTAVATLPEHRGRGLAGRLLAGELEAARARGARTASLQASRAGAPVYERLGFRDLGWIGMWERRTAAATLQAWT